MRKINVLIIEDHALSAFALQTAIKNLDFVENVFSTDCANTVHKILENENIDLAILDMNFSDIKPISIARNIKKKNSLTKILILASSCTKIEVKEYLKIGINGICTNDIKPEKFISVVKEIISDCIYFDSIASFHICEILSEDKKEEKYDEQFKNISVKDCYNLTSQEKRVLILLSSGNNNCQIAKKLSISINTTKVHICSILQKMNVDDRTQAAIKAIKENLIV